MTQNVMRKLKAGTTVAEKTTIFMSEPDVALIISFRYVDLLEFNQEIANRFRVIIDDLRITRNGKITVQETEDEYKKFRKIAMNPEKKEEGTMTLDYSTRADCLLDLTMSYGRFASNRLSNALNDRKQVLGRKLQREEILAEYREIDAELCQKVMTRAGK